SGLVLADLPAFQAARKRVLGAAADEMQAAQAAIEEANAEETLERIGAADQAGETADAPMEDDELDAEGKKKRLTILQQIKSLSKNRNVSRALQSQAQKILEKKV